MAALQCEICGGKLIAKVGGLFECDSCGMQYDKTRIQEMVQQIKGTVQVEGTVQVAGTVKIDGTVHIDNRANAKNCALRAFQIMETNRSDSKALRTDVANTLNDALKMDPECPEAHLGFLFREYWVSNFAQFEAYNRKYGGDFRGNPYYANAEKYTRGTKLHDQLMAVVAVFEQEKKEKTYNQAVGLMEKGALDAAQKTFQDISGYRDAEQLREACLRKKQKSVQIGEAMFQLYRNAVLYRQKAVFGRYIAAVIRPDKTVDVWVDEKFPIHQQILEGVSKWNQIWDICLCSFQNKDSKVEALVGLTINGRILVEGCEDQFKRALSQFSGVQQMKTDGNTLFFTDQSGTLYTSPFCRAMNNPGPRSQIMQWKNISAFDCWNGKFAGYNQKRKELAYCYADFYNVVACPKDVVQIVIGRNREPRLIFSDGTFGEFENNTIRVYASDSVIDCNGAFQMPLDENGTAKYNGHYHFTGIKEYFRGYKQEGFGSGEYYYAVTKRGEAICGKEPDLHCYDKIALALYGDTQRQPVFLLYDGSFVKFTVLRDSVEWTPILKLRAFGGKEELMNLLLVQKEQRKNLRLEYETLQSELSQLKGLFAAKRRKEIEARLMEIETELEGLS